LILSFAILRLNMAITRIKHPYVEKKPGVCGGKAVIKGTRIPVWLIFKRYRAGEPPEEIQTAYPHLSLPQILDAIGYALDNIEGIKADIEENAEEYWQGKLKGSLSLSS